MMPLPFVAPARAAKLLVCCLMSPLLATVALPREYLVDKIAERGGTLGSRAGAVAQNHGADFADRGDRRG
jgi:hypothetical protein